MNPLRTRQSGMAIVEFTIVLPVLLFLFIATAEVGRLLYDYNTLTKAQRNGARFLAAKLHLGGASSYTQFEDLATNLVIYGHINGGGDPLLPRLNDPDPAVADVALDNPTPDDVRVSVTYWYQPMVFSAIPGLGLGGDIDLGLTLRSSVTMRVMRGG